MEQQIPTTLQMLGLKFPTDPRWVGIASRKKYYSYYDYLYVLSSHNQNGIYLINKQNIINMSICGVFLYH